MRVVVFMFLRCKMNPSILLKKLIGLESVSGNEAQLGTFLFSFLQSFFDVQKITVTKNRFNILATVGRPKIYFNTHLDTVPIGKNSLGENDRFIYGRGACDAKGSMAAMICAAICARKKGITDFGLFFNVGEEDDFCGILNGLPEENPQFVVIGEPTELRPIVGQRGLLGFKLSAKGQNAHGATPELGVCAISKVAEAMAVLKQTELPEDASLGKSSLNIGKISGGSSINTVADSASIWVEIRTVVKNSVYRRLLESVLNAFELEYLSDFNPVFLKDESVRLLFESLIDGRTGVKKAFTELFFWPRGIILGPGNPAQAHSDNEFVEKKQLSQAVEIYLSVLDHFATQELNKTKSEVE